MQPALQDLSQLQMEREVLLDRLGELEEQHSDLIHYNQTLLAELDKCKPLKEKWSASTDKLKDKRSTVAKVCSGLRRNISALQERVSSTATRKSLLTLKKQERH